MKHNLTTVSRTKRKVRPTVFFKADNCMATKSIINETNGRSERKSPERYYLTIWNYKKKKRETIRS